MSFHYLKEDSSGALQLENGQGDYLLEQLTGSARVQAVTPGQYMGDYKDVGDVFDILNTQDFSDSTVSQVPIGNVIYPLYGWMLSVPATMALYSWAAFGNSSPVTGIYRSPRYVE